MENRPDPLLLFLVLALVPAQQPDTDVFLVRYDPRASPAVSGPAVNISSNPGYDNQPSFTPDGSAVFFSSNRDGRQTDIYRYDIGPATLHRVTTTAESEYSPLVTPSGTSVSVVRVEADGTQRLWQFDLDGSNPRLVLETVKPVGYHVWIDRSRLALFVLGSSGQPATLQLASTAPESSEVVASAIGRSLLMRPGTRTVSFISRPQGQPAVVMTLDPATRTVTSLTPALEGSQDATWDPRSGRLLMARGSTIFVWAPGESGWREAGDLAAAGLGTITRLALGPDTGSGALHLAVVAERAAR